MKQLLEDTAVFQRRSDSNSGWRKNPLLRIWTQKLGCSGKGIILAGFDYLSMRTSGGFPKSDCVFSSEDLASVVEDGSLTEEEKARCLFNALSYQYYQFPEGCKIKRTLDGIEIPNPDKRQTYFNERLEIVAGSYRRDDADCAVGIYFSGSPLAKSTIFEFSGENSVSVGAEFYKRLEDKLGFLKER